MTTYCDYCNAHPEDAFDKKYHDTQYGFPLKSDDELFERLILEINQAGLSWITILKKADNFHNAYDHFNVEKIAKYSEFERARLLADAGIIRNKLKVNAAIVNAQKILELAKGKSARVIGRNEDSTWWYIRDPGNPSGTCWVSADVVNIQGETGDLPIVNPPLIKVTKINLRIEPARINVVCSQFPQTVFFEAQIAANGPALVTWRLESSAGYISAEHTLVFEESGAQLVNGYYQVPVAGDYWIKIHILKPNDVVEQLNFPANCAP